MALENWIDELVRCSVITMGNQPIRSFRLYEQSEFPAALVADNIPCALVFIKGVVNEYSTGPCYDIWKGQIEYHLTKNTNRDQLPAVNQCFRRIRDVFALHRTLGGKVAYIELDKSGDTISGPLKLQYGSEEWHLGLIANWVAKEITSVEITLGV